MEGSVWPVPRSVSRGERARGSARPQYEQMTVLLVISLVLS
jgi:hypothetical protein